MRPVPNFWCDFGVNWVRIWVFRADFRFFGFSKLAKIKDFSEISSRFSVRVSKNPKNLDFELGVFLRPKSSGESIRIIRKMIWGR